MPISTITPSASQNQTNLLASALNATNGNLASLLNSAIQRGSQDAQLFQTQQNNFINTQARNATLDQQNTFDLRNREQFDKTFGRTLDRDQVGDDFKERGFARTLSRDRVGDDFQDRQLSETENQNDFNNSIKRRTTKSAEENAAFERFIALEETANNNLKAAEDLESADLQQESRRISNEASQAKLNEATRTSGREAINREKLGESARDIESGETPLDQIEESEARVFQRLAKDSRNPLVLKTLEDINTKFGVLNPEDGVSVSGGAGVLPPKPLSRSERKQLNQAKTRIDINGRELTEELKKPVDEQDAELIQELKDKIKLDRDVVKPLDLKGEENNTTDRPIKGKQLFNPQALEGF